MNSKTEKTGFYNNADLHICLIFLRLDVPSLTEIQYFQIEQSKKGTHSHKCVMLKMLDLYGFVRLTKYISWDKEKSYLLLYNLFEFAVEWIPPIKSKTEITFSSKKSLALRQLLIRKQKSVFCVSGILYSQPQSAVWIK